MSLKESIHPRVETSENNIFSEMLKRNVSTPMGALEQLSRAECDMQIMTAKSYPRDLNKALREAKILVSVNPDVAGQMSYSIKRNNTAIEGQSVRFAEVIAYCWGNLRFGARLIHVDQTKVTVQGYCHDLERNNAQNADVVRGIVDRYGKTYSEQMIFTTIMACSSIAIRNAILMIIPKAITQEVYEHAMRVAESDLDKEPLKNRIAKAMLWFGAKGVTESMILATLGRRSIEQISVADLKTLNGYRAALTGGDSTIEELFEPINPSEIIHKARQDGVLGPQETDHGHAS